MPTIEPSAAQLADEVKYQMAEYDLISNEAAKNVADEHGIAFDLVMDAYAWGYWQS